MGLVCYGSVLIAEPSAIKGEDLTSASRRHSHTLGAGDTGIACQQEAQLIRTALHEQVGPPLVGLDHGSRQAGGLGYAQKTTCTSLLLL
jgi:hypothetical protein